ncbi:MAG: hypothetical protein A2751_04030 [Candidatus Doudnabacteria bacterium RIFCSPHIGHO2_01_FULL_46_14]|uniref:Uncharacterized protein n=1 Tax=Candidatus Doudnabacteria bacterium RIFCSPHIGHO2_01_FULL_46_14 TaxID=1817824 RepID=A0A1F5NKR5_9BACT|nr:MAG: hypothetical protein A2751_04030 [Candidatus Doudnabacteria bacterium RIFCSPHIGHO2_01_FULL_46_14]
MELNRKLPNVGMVITYPGNPGYVIPCEKMSFGEEYFTKLFVENGVWRAPRDKRELLNTKGSGLVCVMTHPTTTDKPSISISRHVSPTKVRVQPSKRPAERT